MRISHALNSVARRALEQARPNTSRRHKLRPNAASLSLSVAPSAGILWPFSMPSKPDPVAVLPGIARGGVGADVRGRRRSTRRSGWCRSGFSWLVRRPAGVSRCVLVVARGPPRLRCAPRPRGPPRPTSAARLGGPSGSVSMTIAWVRSSPGARPRRWLRARAIDVDLLGSRPARRMGGEVDAGRAAWRASRGDC